MGSMQSSSASLGSQQSAPSQPAHASEPLPCSREMDDYLQCVRSHSEGLSGAVDECDAFRQHYKLCMAEYKKAKNRKS